VIVPRKFSTDSRKVYQWLRQANVAKLLIDEGCAVKASKPWSYWPSFTKFVHDVAKSSQMNFSHQECDTTIRFSFDAEVGCHGNSLERSKKEGQISNL